MTRSSFAFLCRLLLGAVCALGPCGVGAQTAKRPAPAPSAIGSRAAIPVLDINTASKADLARMPAIGPATADKIVLSRTVSPFANKYQLVSRGIMTEGAYQRVKDYIVASQK